MTLHFDKWSMDELDAYIWSDGKLIPRREQHLWYHIVHDYAWWFLLYLLLLAGLYLIPFKRLWNILVTRHFI